MGHYIDGEKLTKELTIWTTHARKYLEENGRLPKLTDYLGECIYLICNNISYKQSFINYTFKTEMIGTAIENCIRYVKNYNPEYGTGFNYISFIAGRAFVRVIIKEKKRHLDHLSYIRSSFTEDDITNVLDKTNPGDKEAYSHYINHMQSILDDMDVELPIKPPRKKRKRKPTMLDNILTGEEY